MELKVASTLFNSNGGGGGGFFMGRGDKDERRQGREEADETGEMSEDALAISGPDAIQLPPRHRSSLALGALLPAPIAVDEEAVVAELESAIQMKMRLLDISVARLERDYARRLRAEIGDILIGA
jgi:hypothetical protein